MNVHDPLDQLTEIVSSARAMPMSASCIVNRGEVLDLLDDVRGALPTQIREADALIGEREQVMAEAQVQADEVLAEAHSQAALLVSQEWVYAAALREADVIRGEAQADAERMRREVDDYVDGKLANFEVALHKTLTAVERGRDKIRGRQESEFDDPDEPLPG